MTLPPHSREHPPRLLPFACVLVISAVLLSSLLVLTSPAVPMGNPGPQTGVAGPGLVSLAAGRSGRTGALAIDSPALSGAAAGSLVQTIFPNYNASIAGNFPATVREWDFGSPAYVPTTHSLWIPVRITPGAGLPEPSLAPALIYNTSSNQFEGFVFSVENASAFAYDPSNGLLYSADYANSTVGVLNPITESWMSPAIPVGLSPVALAIDLSTNTLYVANYGSGNITVINCSTDAIENPGISTGPEPRSLAIDPYAHTLFIADGGDSDLRTLNTSTSAMGTPYLLPGAPGSVGYSESLGAVAVTVPTYSKMYLLNASGLFTINATTVGLGFGPITTNSTGTSFILGNLSGSDLVKVNASTGAVVDSNIPVGQNVTSLLTLPGSATLLAWASSSHNISTVNLRSDRPVASSPTLAPEPWNIGLDVSTNRAFVADPLGGAVSVLNARTGRMVSDTLSLKSRGLAVDVDAATNVLYVGTLSGVESFNATTLAPLPGAAAIAGGNSPLLVDKLDGLLWVVNQGSGIHALHLGSLSPAFTVPIQPGFQAQNGMTLDPSLDALFVINQTAGYVEEVNASNGHVADSKIPAGTNPTAITYDSSDNSLYVAGANLTILNPATRQIVGPTIPLVAHNVTSAIAFDPTRSYLYVTTSLGRPADASTVSVIDGVSVSASTGSQVTIPVGELATSVTPISFAGSQGPAFSSIWVTNALSGTVSVIASPPVISFFTASPSSIDLGQTSQLLLGYSGGTGPDTIAYSGLPSGCVSMNSSELNCTPSVSGTFAISAVVSDALGESANASTVLSVAPSLQLGTTFLPGLFPSVDVGTRVSASVAATGGTAPYSYQWSFGDGASASGANVSHSYVSAGTYLLSVTATDAAHATATDSTVVTVDPDPTGAITVGPANATDIGRPLHFAASISGGTGPGAGEWTFGNGSNATGLNATHEWNVSGSYAVRFSYNDSLGVGFNETINVTIDPLLTGTFSTSAGTAGASVGSAVSFGAVPHGGLAPYNVTWAFGDGSYGYGTKATHEFAATGSYSVRVALTDSAGAVVNATLTVHVTTSPTSVTPDAQLFVGVLVGIALAAVVLFAASRARRKSPPPPSPTVPPEGPEPSKGTGPTEG